MITSTSNQKVKELIRLREKSRAREEEGCFLVEGPRMVREIPSYGAKNGKLIEAARETGISTEMLSDDVFARVSDTKTPQGVLAAVRMVKYSFSDILGVKKNCCTYPCAASFSAGFFFAEFFFKRRRSGESQAAPCPCTG